jgi:hypothetical protein
VSDEPMWSEFSGLWGMALEELEEPSIDGGNGILHPMPNFGEDDNIYPED